MANKKNKDDMDTSGGGGTEATRGTCLIAQYFTDETHFIKVNKIEDQPEIRHTEEPGKSKVLEEMTKEEVKAWFLANYKDFVGKFVGTGAQMSRLTQEQAQQMAGDNTQGIYIFNDLQALKKQGWKRDLLRECVEANPGPWWSDIRSEVVKKLPADNLSFWTRLLDDVSVRLAQAFSEPDHYGVFTLEEVVEFLTAHQSKLDTIYFPNPVVKTNLVKMITDAISVLGVSNTGGGVAGGVAGLGVEDYGDSRHRKRKFNATGRSNNLPQVSQLHSILQQADLSHLSDPSIVSSLPFPSLAPAPERFYWEKGYFKFVGRAAISKLEDAVHSFLNPPAARLFGYENRIHNLLVYGNVGAGKSHALMALALKIRKEYMATTPVSRRIVIVPNAADLIGVPGFDNMLSAMLIAYADHDPTLKALAAIREWEELAQFCSSADGLVFLVDQAEKIDISVTTLDTPAAHARASLLSLISVNHFAIFGASANADMAKFRNKTKQSGYGFYDVFGGLTAEEMVKWLKHVDITLSGDQIKELHDYCGGVPLFLSWFIALMLDSFSNFPCDLTDDDGSFITICANYKQQHRIIKICNEVDELVSSGKLHDDNVMAFLTNSALSIVDFDSRYIYMSNNKGYCIAGFVRNQLAQSLRRYKGGRMFLSEKWLRRVCEEKGSTTCNNSVLGFLAEQAVLSTIATEGIQFSGKLYKITSEKWFSQGEETDALPAKEEGAIFLPQTYNYPNVDAVLTFDTNPKPSRVGVQITLAPYAQHSHSAEQFMHTGVCSKWICGGKATTDYDWYFLWIMPKFQLDAVPDTTPHPSKYYTTRNSKDKLQVVPYTELFYTFHAINPGLDVLDKQKL